MLSDLNRRNMLALSGVGLAVGAAGVAKAAGPASLLDAYETTRGFKNRTAFWLARGARYALVGTRLFPFQRSMVMEAVRFDRSGDVMHSSTLEGSFSFNMAGEVSYQIENPLTHAPVTIKPGSALVVDFHYAADGSLSLAPSSQTRGTVRGSLTLERGHGAPDITEAFAGYASTPPVGEPALSEVIVYKPDAASSSSKGFLRATKSLTVVRDWPYPAPEGVSARLLTLYEGKKFGTVDALVEDAGEAMVKAVYPDLIERFRKF